MRTRTALAVVLAGVLALAGCGGAADDEAGACRTLHIGAIGNAEAKADWARFLAYTVGITGFSPAIVATTTVADQWPTEPFTPEGLALLKGTKEFLRQKFIRTDFDLDDWIIAQSS